MILNAHDVFMSGHGRAVSLNDPYAFQRIADLEAEIGFTMQPGGTILESIKQKVVG